MRQRSHIGSITARPTTLSFWQKYCSVWIVTAFVVSFVTLPCSVHAITSLSQGYSTTDKLPIGSIVSLKDNSSDQVEATSTKNVDSILGVVINNGTSLLSLSNGDKDQVQVATSGTAPILVSNINGDIAQGDQITASPVKGVGMKATHNTKVVGLAQANATISDKHTQSYTDEHGAKHTISLGEVPIQVNVAYFYVQPEKTIIPAALQNIANALAGKKVDTLPIIISAITFIIALIVVVSIIYTMIRSSIISVGRNPMAQSAVYRDVIQLSALVLGILAVTVIVIYMILTRL